MPTVSNTVDQARTLLERRLRELDNERRQVEAALAGLGKSARRGPGRPRGSRGRRRRRGGTRADQAVKIIGENPGIGVAELGKKMGLKHPNYLYRVLPDLKKRGRIKKRAGLHLPDQVLRRRAPPSARDARVDSLAEKSARPVPRPPSTRPEQAGKPEIVPRRSSGAVRGHSHQTSRDPGSRAPSHETWSIAAFAARRRSKRRGASMIAAPRFRPWG
jgi:hypothetical protein